MNLARVIEGHDPESTALISRGRPTTYGELYGQIERLRGGLSAIGVGDGDRVAVLCSNSRHFVITYFATLGLGAVVVPLNPLSPARELESEISNVSAKVVVIEKVSTATWSNVDRLAVPSVRTVVSCDPSSAPEGAVPIGELLAAAPVDLVDVEPDHLATLIFTSGTAGRPRAAMLTHGNLAANREQSLSSGDHVDASDVLYTVLPLFHIFGLNVAMTMGLSVGATVLLDQRFDPTTAIDMITEYGVTVLPGSPSMWSAFASFDQLDGSEFSTVRLALSGAARLPIATARLMRDRFGLDIYEGYGLTEASPIVTSSTGADVRFGSVGRVLDGVRVRLVNADGDIPAGDVGEIWVQGPNVFAGYFRDADATDAVLTEDGWLKTGDMATVDDDGFLWLVDRAKDLVIVSGFNVFPAEVEDVLHEHPDVVEAGVIGVPHPHTGEAVKAFVVAVDGSDVDEESLVEFCLDHLARYKCPNKIEFVDELPRNASGKLVRRELAL
ncbi:MAG: AMP-binding protein [Ilumatobacter sp.]|uniref:AMP-binding protein n=1 Tax=Ilumatobacter sp. TaxID=1967498 RepID=UPI0032970BA4